MASESQIDDRQITMFWAGVFSGPLMALAFAGLFHGSLRTASFYMIGIGGVSFLVRTVYARIHHRS